MMWLFKRKPKIQDLETGPRPIPDRPTRPQLLALPRKPWKESRRYDWLYIVPSGEPHDSGYAVICVVGVNRDAEVSAVGEICGWCDDINWSFPTKHPYDKVREGQHYNILRTDIEYPSGIVRMWASSELRFKGRFEVGATLSSLDVCLVLEDR